jgi:mRNA-degrading endonuclease YafQ of YafQ-DinJ toxin-antitoxin module
MRVWFTPRFVRMVGSLAKDLQEDVYEKVDLFCDPKNHPALKVHTLRGILKGFSSFSVNYKTRVIFEMRKDGVILHAVGDHDVYKI